MRTIWSKLSKSKRYRSQFVSATARRAFAFQLRAIMRKRELSQEQLAERCGLSQGVISRAADPNYGTLTVTIKTKIANGLDMAYLGTLVPFSEAAKWFSDLSEESVTIPSFEEENASLVGISEREVDLTQRNNLRNIGEYKASQAARGFGVERLNLTVGSSDSDQQNRASEMLAGAR